MPIGRVFTERIRRKAQREDELVPGGDEGVDDDRDDAGERERQRDAEEDADPRLQPSMIAASSSSTGIALK